MNNYKIVDGVYIPLITSDISFLDNIDDSISDDGSASTGDVSYTDTTSGDSSGQGLSYEEIEQMIDNEVQMFHKMFGRE